MRILSASELLDVWERGLAQQPLERALELLGAACPEMSPDALAHISIGRRDAGLLTLRAWTFGAQMAGVISCARCGDRLELVLDLAGLPLPSLGAEATEVSLELPGYEIRFRPPNSADLAACASLGLVAIRAQLLARCVIEVRSESRTVAADQLPEHCMQAIMERMAEADPQADIQVDIACPACNHRWRQTFDIVSFFWSEIDAWARRVLREVHSLALAYGWSENEILALSPRRRQLYLEMAGA
jgi:DNA-directed RNA polymerase subunit RPC12/RpoP